MMRKILVGTDGSDTAAVAVGRAAELAADMRAELIVFSAYQTAKDAAAANKIVDSLVKILKGQKARAVVREGNAADAILDVAEEEGADLIVMGNKGMTGARRFFLGGVPNRVSHNAGCSVLIVKTT